MTVDQLNQMLEAIDSLKLLTTEYYIWLSGDPAEDSPTLQINRAIHILIEHVPNLVRFAAEVEPRYELTAKAQAYLQELRS